MPHEQMSERVRDTGDGLILAFPIASTEVAQQTIDTTRLYFFRVGSETRFFQKYTALADIAGDGTTPTDGYDFLGDTGVGSGDDIFRNSTDDWHVMHFGLAPNSTNLEVFYAVSPKANGEPAQDRTGTGEDITPGTDDRGWFTRAQIDDIYDPPAFTERVSFRNDDNGEFLLFAFHNDLANTTLSTPELDLYLSGAGYKLQPVLDRQTQDVMLEEALSRPANPQIDTIIHQVGGVNNYTLGTEEPDAWKSVRDNNNWTRTFNVEDLPLPGGDGGDGGQPDQVTTIQA